MAIILQTMEHGKGNCLRHIRHHKSVRTIGIVLSIAFYLGSCGIQAAEGPQLPDGPGKATTQKICSGCHAAEIVMGRHETHEGWEQIVGKMVSNGANGTDDEFNEVIDYLAKNFPKQSDAKPSGQAQH